MKVRIGFGLGTGTDAGGPRGFRALVDALEANRFDSLWLSERVSGAALDPLIGLAVAAARTEKLKLGTSVLVLPGRPPALLAKELATLDVLSEGRLLPAFGLGVADPVEQQAFGVERKERVKIFDEALALLRAFWKGEPVTHHGDRYHYDGVLVQPKPVGRMEVWLGGASEPELRRVGRVGDGWLPSFTSPERFEETAPKVNAAAAEAGRAIDPEHLGVLVPYLVTEGAVPDPLARIIEARSPGTDPRRVVPTSYDTMRALLTDFVAVGASKFVLVPIGGAPSAGWAAALSELAAEVLPLEAALSS